MNLKTFHRGMLACFLLLLLWCLFGCSSVKKTEKKSTSDIAVSKSDSSKVKVVTVIDTTKTDNSTEITTTTTVYDEPFISLTDTAGVHTNGIGTYWSKEWKPISLNGTSFKAKKVTVTITSNKSRAIIHKGESSAAIEAITVKKVDSTKSVITISSEKRKSGSWMWLWWFLIPLAIIVWKRHWIIDKFYV